MESQGRLRTRPLFEGRLDVLNTACLKGGHEIGAGGFLHTLTLLGYLTAESQVRMRSESFQTGISDADILLGVAVNRPDLRALTDKDSAKPPVRLPGDLRIDHLCLDLITAGIRLSNNGEFGLSKIRLGKSLVLEGRRLPIKEIRINQAVNDILVIFDESG